MKKNLTCFLSCVLILATCFSSAQETKAPTTSRAIDSLLHVLKTLSSSSAELKLTIEGESSGLRSDTTKINILNELSMQYRGISNYDQALYYAQQAQRHGENLMPVYKNGIGNLALKKGIALAYYNGGTAYGSQGNYENGMTDYLQALKIFEAIGYKNRIANCYNAIGTIYQDQGAYEKALNSYLKSMKIFESMGDKKGAIGPLGNIALIYLNQQDYENSLKNFLKVLKMNEDAGNKPWQASNLLNIGVVYQYQGNYIKAIDYYLKSLKLYEEIGDINGMAISYNNIGEVYSRQASADTTKKGSENGYKNALDVFLKALKIFLEIGDKRGMAAVYANVGTVYMKQGKLKESYEYAIKSLAICKETGYKEGVRDAYATLSDLYEKKGDYKKAFEYQKLFSETKDTLLNEMSSKQMTEMNTKYDSEKKDKAIQLLNKDKENQASLTAAEKRKQQVILFSVSGFSLFLMGFAMFIYRSYRQKQLLNKELEKLSIVASETDNGVLICGPNGELEWCNAGLTRLSGYSLEEIKQRGATLEEVSSSPEIKFLIQQSIENKKTSVYETLTIAKDGNTRWMQSTLTPILDEKGNIKKLVVIDTDISERKKIEEKLSEQNKLVANKNLKIIDSITYARQIQRSILMEESEIQHHLPDSFIYYHPKDIVSGDFYWFSKVNDVLILAAIDCTGHGVPGAFMSMIGNTLLNQIVNEKLHTQPSEILRLLNLGIYEALHQQKVGSLSHDGMDIALCSIDYKNAEVQFAGAQNPLYVVWDNNVEIIKADIHTIGGGGKISTLSDPLEKTYTNHIIPMKKGMSLYLFSDGYMDQFGGPTRKKFGILQFKDLLLSNQHLNMQQQKEKIIKAFEGWKGASPQIDDVLVMGLRL